MASFMLSDTYDRELRVKNNYISLVIRGGVESNKPR